MCWNRCDLDKLAYAGFDQDHLQVAIEIRDHTELEVVRKFLQKAAAARQSVGRLPAKLAAIRSASR